MAYDSDKAHVVSDDGLLIEGGVHYIGGVEVPTHSPTVPTVYNRTNGECYFNEGTGGPWVLQGANSGAGFQKYFVPSGETYTIPQGVSTVITGPFELEGILDVNGRVEVL